MMSKGKLVYPVTKRDTSAIDTYKNDKGQDIQVADPYRWLEDSKSEETKNWVTEQNKVTEEFLNQDDSKLTDKLVDEYMERINYPKYGVHRRRGSKLIYSKNPGLLNQSVVYITDLNDSEKREQVLIDPNEFSKDGTWAISSVSLSDSGKYYGYGYSKGGSDWVNLQVIKVPERVGIDKPETLPDIIEWAKFTSITWTPDELGFLYSRFPAPSQTSKEEAGTETDSNQNHELYYHKLGTDQSEDVLVYKADPQHPEYMYSCEFTDDHKYLFIYTSRDCNPECNLSVITNWRDVLKVGGGVQVANEIKLVTDFNASYSLLYSKDTTFYFQTNLNAPLQKIITMTLDTANMSAKPQIKDLIPQQEILCQWTSVSSNKLYVAYSKDVKDIVRVFDINGKYLHDLVLPGPGTVSGFTVHKSHNHIYMFFESFIYPSCIFYIDSSSSDDKVTLYLSPEVHKGYNPENYVCKQVFYESKDKTKIPMFITHRKGLELTGSTPTYLTGYGGFEISYTPYFSPQFIFFIDKFDGVFALANIRGGGEYGKTWHQGGSLHTKQNCFDDFIAAAEYLVDSKYTSPSKITINGGSNGGLLVGACTNQRPDLFACSLADVGVMDMLKFHKFTIGHHWKSDYGCSEDPKDFEYIYGYSPLHNVNKKYVDSKGSYPFMLLNTGDHDDRVIPAHSYKYISELQYQLGTLPNQTNPLLIKIDVKAGHGAGKPLKMRAAEFCTKLAFISKAIKQSPILKQ